MPILNKPASLDIPAMASKLPRPLQWPVGAILGGLSSVTGGDDPNAIMGVAAPMPIPEASGAIQGLSRAIPREVPQVKPTSEDVNGMIGSLKQRLAQVPQSKSIMPTSNPPTTGGVGSQVFQQMNDAGAFQGDRSTGHFIEGPGGLSSLASQAWGSAVPPAATASQVVMPVPTSIGGLGVSHPEFTPRGGERSYNATQGLKSALVDPVEAAYQRIMSRMGK